MSLPRDMERFPDDGVQRAADDDRDGAALREPTPRAGADADSAPDRAGTAPAGRTVLAVWGIDHHRAPTEVRERAHLSPQEGQAFVLAATADEAVVSALPLCTCNRTEIFLELRDPEGGRRALERALAAVGVDIALFDGPYGFHLGDEDAVRHLYRVIAGLESLMLGEKQISGQVKDAYRLASDVHPLGPVTLRAFQGAFRTGKRVRLETGISSGAVSVAFAAVELARRFFDDLGDKRALLVGAGETGALAARHFLKQGIGTLSVVNRSIERAEQLSGDLDDGSGRIADPRPLSALAEALGEADVVLTATGSREPIVIPELMGAAIRRRRGRPLFLLDIAVPRDVDPAVTGMDGVYLFGLDDLDEVVEANLAARRAEIPRAEKIVEEELVLFRKWMDDMDLRPTVAEFKAYLEDLKDRQMSAVRRQLPAEAAEAVEQSLQWFIKKLVGKPVSRIKQAPSPEHRTQDLDSLRRLFELDQD